MVWYSEKIPRKTIGDAKGIAFPGGGGGEGDEWQAMS